MLSKLPEICELNEDVSVILEWLFEPDQLSPPYLVSADNCEKLNSFMETELEEQDLLDWLRKLI